MQNLRIRDPGPVRGGGKQAISAEWANRMRDCIMALARVIPQQTRKPAEWNPKHPFQATANGDDTVNIAAGKVIYWQAAGSGSFPNEPFTATWDNVDATDVTVTSTGIIYLVIDTESTEVSDDGIVWDFVYVPAASGITVEFDPTATGDELLLPICAVSLTDGVASVTQQVLDHNPRIDFGFSIWKGV